MVGPLLALRNTRRETPLCCAYRAINNSLNELTKSAGAAERVLALMDVPPTPENEETSNYALMARNGKWFGASPCFSNRPITAAFVQVHPY